VGPPPPPGVKIYVGAPPWVLGDKVFLARKIGEPPLSLWAPWRLFSFFFGGVKTPFLFFQTFWGFPLGKWPKGLTSGVWFMDSREHPLITPGFNGGVIWGLLESQIKKPWAV